MCATLGLLKSRLLKFFLHKVTVDADAGKSFVITRSSVAACAASRWHMAPRGKDHAHVTTHSPHARLLRGQRTDTHSRSRTNTLISATSRRDGQAWAATPPRCMVGRKFPLVSNLWLISGTGCGCWLCDWTPSVLSGRWSMFVSADHAARHVHWVGQ